MSWWLDIDRSWDLWSCVGDAHEWTCAKLFSVADRLEAAVAIAFLISTFIAARWLWRRIRLRRAIKLCAGGLRSGLMTPNRKWLMLNGGKSDPGEDE